MSLNTRSSSRPSALWTTKSREVSLGSAGNWAMRLTLIEPESPQSLLILAPALFVLDPQLEIDPGVQKPLELQAGTPADFLEEAALRSDEYALLALPLHIDNGRDVQNRLALALLHRLDLNNDAVRNLLFGQFQDLLPYYLSDDELLRVVRYSSWRIVRRAGRQQRQKHLQESVQPLTGFRGDRKRAQERSEN